jgi:hypothetical protein
MIRVKILQITKTAARLISVAVYEGFSPIKGFGADLWEVRLQFLTGYTRAELTDNAINQNTSASKYGLT